MRLIENKELSSNMNTVVSALLLPVKNQIEMNGHYHDCNKS